MVSTKRFAPSRFLFNKMVLSLAVLGLLSMPLHTASAGETKPQATVKTISLPAPSRTTKKSTSAMALVAMAFGLQNIRGPVEKVAPSNINQAQKIQAQQYADKGL